MRRLDALGIGRPSTWAAILAVLREREYVLLHERRFVPTERGRVVIAFLEGQFWAVGGVWLHRRDGGGPRPDRRGPSRLARDAGGVLGSLPRGARRGRRAGTHGGAEGGGGPARAVPVRRRGRGAGMARRAARRRWS